MANITFCLSITLERYSDRGYCRHKFLSHRVSIEWYRNRLHRIEIIQFSEHFCLFILAIRSYYVDLLNLPSEQWSVFSLKKSRVITQCWYLDFIKNYNPHVSSTQRTPWFPLFIFHSISCEAYSRRCICLTEGLC